MANDFVVGPNNQQYHLGWLPPDPKVRMALPRFGDAVPTVPRSSWRTISRRSAWNVILNQRSHGSCVGFASVAALMRSFWLSGRDCPPLSGSYVYSFINGGQDRGAIIHEALAVLRDEGTCPDALNDCDKIYPRQITAEARNAAKQWKGLEFYRAESFDEVMSAVQLGYVPVFAVMVGSRFTTLDSKGVCGFDAGPGNHAVHADGANLDDVANPLLDMPNSWGETFGQNGRGYLKQAHIDNIGYQDCYVIRVPRDAQNDAPAAT